MDADRLIYPLMKHVVLGPAMHVAFRPRIEGLEHLPRSGPVILAANHLAVCDSFLLPLMVPRQVFFLGKNEYFTQPGIRGRVQAAFFRGVGAIAVDRSGGRAALAAMDASAEVLERGQVFAIHPEGTRSPDGRLYRGRTGVARLALRTGAPVVPAAIEGTDRVQPPGRTVPRPGRLSVRIGAPMDFLSLRAKPGERTTQATARKATDQIMHAIQELSGQQYVDSYAPRRGE
ncbi:MULTISPECIES: lysophospholipid acyltransferase family protein [Thermomonosporaceae]|uniref:lysophospholipid acyltransferase family protein n=1 Tax=Thermomonosporaceae TaxID=2012 RepID=UPI00255B0D6B|nr:MULTISPECIES: lysophospholipid acyltransferase family protein [Thermomonosporaceae]MDL4774562.1 lysophospholipid acyltransferase family protein [Actinomadura xylanilytica]